MAVFYSFHYERDVNRVQLIRQMGLIEGQPILNAQEWESVRARGSSVIANWIDEQMKYKAAVIVLIGRETASRPWVRYEIQKAWNARKPLLGIRIHGLSSMGTVDTIGPDPFTQISGFEGRNPGLPIFDPTVSGVLGDIDSKATYQNLVDHLRSWSSQGRVRQA
ncbi:TIR domain-containing protein [Corynebacterium sp. MSK039]|uniref:TIR domain-containing protein n=1 Tax=Corynebacterium sp. MSK039 TaxID=3050193 RepID=UPI00254DB399|nr:TIR domain-containing protein [Corynebacterium sp. MSK039]MDK8791508.1 TIR domain-containing protein [Corynebacterium sp. MSK039]